MTIIIPGSSQYNNYVKELEQKNAALVAALEAIQALAQNPNHRTMRTQLQMCSFFDDIVLPITDNALVEASND